MTIKEYKDLDYMTARDLILDHYRERRSKEVERSYEWNRLTEMGQKVKYDTTCHLIILPELWDKSLKKWIENYKII